MSDGASLNFIITEHWPRQESSKLQYIKLGKLRSLDLENFAKTENSNQLFKPCNPGTPSSCPTTDQTAINSRYALPDEMGVRNL